MSDEHDLGLAHDLTVLDQSGIVRRDIRSSFGGMSGRARGIP